MKKTIMFLIAILLLAGCAKDGGSLSDKVEIAKLKETLAARDKAIETLMNEKETMQALLNQFDPNVLAQNSMVYTSIPLLMTSEAKCSTLGRSTRCALPSTNASLILPIMTMPSFIYVLNPTPTQIFIVYYDEKELWVYADYAIVSKAEADSIMATSGVESIVKTLPDGRVLMTLATPGIALSNPLAIDAFTKQFKDKLNGSIDLQFELISTNG